MNLYTMLGNGTHEAASLGARLTAWHDAMVAHERKIRTGRIAEVCDEECPHAEARTLWTEAQEVFGNRAHELTFLRSRATATSEPSKELVASPGGRSEAANRGRRSNDSNYQAVARRSKLFVDAV